MNRILRCIAIDDEPLALEVLEKFCARYGGISIDTYSNPQEGMSALADGMYDVAFLDIQMGDVNGLNIAASIPADTCFIFTTAYLEYAFDGFNLDAIDYLHKPFSYDRFRVAVDKAIRRLEYNDVVEAGKSIVVKQEYNNVTIALSDILYVEAMEGYCKIFRSNGVCTLSRVMLKTLGAMLPAKRFIRIHRSYIVSADKVRSFTRQNITLVNGVTIPVGRQYSGNLAGLSGR